MAKRVATKQLTMDNYDQDDDDDYPEADAGPKIASPEVLKSRPIARAKRRSELNASADETKKPFGSFGGFTGFSHSLQTNSFASTALKSLPQTQTNETAFRTSTPLLTTQTNGSKTVTETTESADSQISDDDPEDLYNKKLSQLNRSFAKHINSYMSRSEFYDFTQVCKEYIEFQKKIESEANAQTATDSKPSSQSSHTSVKTSDTKSDYISNPSSQNTFGSQALDAKSTPFPSQSSSGPTSSLFPSQTSVTDSSFFAKPLQFNSNAIKPMTEESANEKTKTEDTNEEESDEPPKVESVEHKEPDSVYNKKCKLFFKKGNDWSNKGVGFLFIKKESDTSTPQLLIRADNKLGTILLHISLKEEIPVTKASNNKGVMIGCIPNPPLDPKAKTQETVTFLIRVRAQDNEELFDNLVKYKSNH